MDSVLISDQQIAALIDEPKPVVLPEKFEPTKAKKKHRETRISITGEHGSQFEIIVRRAAMDPTDFSIILGWNRPGVSGLFHLLRCNGNSHHHPNKLEREVIHGFHVHYATERYQQLGGPPEGYARPAKYDDFSGAIDAFIELANIGRPDSPSALRLFPVNP